MKAEHGNASIAMLGIIAAVIAAMMGALAVGSAAHAGQRARGGADLAALAAASRYQEGSSVATACQQGAAIAQRNDARLVECALGSSGEALVRVEAEVAWRLPGVSPVMVSARAKAGPSAG